MVLEHNDEITSFFFQFMECNSREMATESGSHSSRKKQESRNMREDGIWGIALFIHILATCIRLFWHLHFVINCYFIVSYMNSYMFIIGLMIELIQSFPFFRLHLFALVFSYHTIVYPSWTPRIRDSDLDDVMLEFIEELSVNFWYRTEIVWIRNFIRITSSVRIASFE